LEVTEGESSMDLKDGGDNYYKRQDSVSGVNEVNFYIHHGGNID
jgi:hypothetical protein